MTDFRDRIADGEFENRVAYPDRPSKPRLERNHTSAEVTAYAKQLALYETLNASYRADLDAYLAEDRAAYEFFKTELLKDLGIADHPKAERLFTMAWEDGHSEGYEAVYSRAEDLSELMV